MKRGLVILGCQIIFVMGLDAQVINSFALPSSAQTPLPPSNVVNKIVPRGDTLWIGSGKGPTFSADGGGSWRLFSSSDTFDDKGVSAVAVRGNDVWISTTYITHPDNVSHQTGHGLHYSPDRGQSWKFISQPVDTGLVDTLVYGRNKIPTLDVTVAVDNVTYDIALTQSTVWIASWAGSLRKSTNGGASWTRVILPPDNLNAISPTDTLHFALSVVDRKFDSDSLVGNLNHRAFSVYASNDSTIWVGTANGINKSTDGGISWRKFNHQNQDQPISGDWVLGITEQHWGATTILWAATVNAVDSLEKRGVSFSNNGGESWRTALLGEWAHNIATRDSIVYVATDDGVYRSNDLGQSWIRSGTIYDPTTLQRFASSVVYAVGVRGDTVWAGGPEGLAYTLDNRSSAFGSSWRVFRTYQPVQASGQTYSYPLPFSPATEVVRLHFSTSGKTAPVSIRIFDFAMQPVKTLLQDAVRSGSIEHDEIWDGRDDKSRRVANGVYFYRVEVDGGDAQWGKILRPPMTRQSLNIAIVLLTAGITMYTAGPGIACAQTAYDIGGLAGAAMRMGFGARGMAMGNALTAVSFEDETGYYNPALVPFQSRPGALLSAGLLPLDRNLNFASYTQSIKPSGGFSLAVINAGVSKIQGRDVDGRPTDTYSTSENEFLFTFGSKIRPEFAVGVSAKILYYSLFQGVKSTTVGFDLGALYTPAAEWSVALVVADINSKYKWDTSQLYGADGNTTVDRFPLRRKIAVCYSPGYLNGRIAGEFEWIGTVLVSRIGTEIALHENVSLRGGIDQIDFGGKINAKPSIGFSVRTAVGSWKPTLDYGYILEPYATGGIHMLSLRVSFE